MTSMNRKNPMTVEDLINLLKTYDKSYIVQLEIYTCGTTSYEDLVRENIRIERDRPAVIIDAAYH